MTKNKLFIYEDMIGFASLVDRMKEDSALKIVNSARISYSKKKEEFDESDKKLAHYLRINEHTSPWRHTYFTFHLKIPLFVMRQIIKYQVGCAWRTYEIDGQSVQFEVFDHMFNTDNGTNWNEISGRYSVLKPEFYIPSKMRANVGHNKQASENLPDDFDHNRFKVDMMRDCEAAYKKYEERLESGISKEIARMLLPQNIYSESYWTCSLQAILHFLEQRLNKSSQYEIRMLANAIYTLIEDDMKRLGIPREALGWD